MSAKGAAELAVQSPEHHSSRPQLGNLQKVLLERVDMLTKALEQKAITDFNDWLVCSSHTTEAHRTSALSHPYHLSFSACAPSVQLLTP